MKLEGFSLIFVSIVKTVIMAQISVGKLLPNLKVTLGNDTSEVDTSAEKNVNISEEYTENTEGNPNVEIVRSWMESLQNPKVYKNKSGGFTTGLDLISEENTELLSKRAERFGLEKEESPLGQNVNSLYESLGITPENRYPAKGKNVRLDALHMRGVNELSTNEIFHYFKDYGPASVEWINDFSCNVVWLDEASCARALLGVSKPLSSLKEDESMVDSSGTNDQELPAEEQNESKSEVSMDIDDDSQLKSGSSDIPVPPGHWRLGMAHSKAKSIMLRFATKDDRKLPGAEKRSDYYKKYGNPNYGEEICCTEEGVPCVSGLKGLISSSRKRKMQAASNKRAIEVGSTRSISLKPDSPELPVERVSHARLPRMRMYADDEEVRTRKIRDSLWNMSKTISVHSRLGHKYTTEDLCHLGSYHGGPGREKSPSDDLRTKLKRIRRDHTLSKHRSPLCDMDD